MVRGATSDFDRRILLAMRVEGELSNPIGPPWMEEVGRDLTALGGMAVLTLLVVSTTAFFWLSAMHRAAVYVALACLGALAISFGLKRAFDPDDVMNKGCIIPRPGP